MRENQFDEVERSATSPRAESYVTTARAGADGPRALSGAASVLFMQEGQARSHLSHLITGYLLSQAIFCAAALGIADQLSAGPRTAAALAESLGCSPNPLVRLMRALCTIGVFWESPNGFHLTPVSRLLSKNIKGSMWSTAVYHGHEMYRAFGSLLDNVRTGTPAWEVATGETWWSYLAAHEDRSTIFQDVMRNNHAEDLHELVEACDFSGARVVADLGGGDGSMLREILARHPSATGVLFELPDVVTRAKADDDGRADTSRVRFVSGDIFEAVPPGADVYLMRHVLHDWDDDRCLQALRRCLEAMASGARLVLIEAVLDGQSAGWAGWSDLGIMVMGGKERTYEEYAHLCTTAGFADFRRLPSNARVALMEARAP